MEVLAGAVLAAPEELSPKSLALAINAAGLPLFALAIFLIASIYAPSRAGSAMLLAAAADAEGRAQRRGPRRRGGGGSCRSWRRSSWRSSAPTAR
eukprot:2388796-Rhodomonas_salina.3